MFFGKKQNKTLTNQKWLPMLQALYMQFNLIYKRNSGYRLSIKQFAKTFGNPYSLVKTLKNYQKRSLILSAIKHKFTD